MYQGETITVELDGFPIPIDDISDLYLVFRTTSRVLLEKTLDDFVVNEEQLICVLSQAETLKFTCGQIDIQIIVIARDGSRFECSPPPLICGPTIKKEVLP